jgi:hypothetical protein
MNGYIQADILGRTRGLKFGMLAVQQIGMEMQKLGKVFGDNSIDLAAVPVIIYWGLFNNCYMKKEDPDFTFEEVVDFVDENISTPDLFTPILQAFYDSKFLQPTTTAPQEEQKKSSTSTRKKAGTS